MNWAGKSLGVQLGGVRSGRRRVRFAGKAPDGRGGRCAGQGGTQGGSARRLGWARRGWGGGFPRGLFGGLGTKKGFLWDSGMSLWDGGQEPL